MIVYLLLINAAGLVFMLVDKYRAKNDMWRIPENTLIGIALVGGSLGCILGMRFFRHKTRKPKFFIGLPVILVIQLLVLVYFFR